MAPTEALILSGFLLPPAPLPAFISLKAFTELFPRSQQSSPLKSKHSIETYNNNELNSLMLLPGNIAAEAKRGIGQRRVVIRARRAAEKEDQDDEADVENALFGSTSNLPISKPHTLSSILPELSSATEDLEDEIRRLDEEAESLYEAMQSTVGGLSDLRYGRLANNQLREQVLEGLERLEKSCEKR